MSTEPAESAESAESAEPAEQAEAESRQSTTRTPLWLDVTLAVLFGLFYAYDVWEVVGSIVVPMSLGLGFSALGWVVLVVALIAPIALFSTAFALGRHRSAVAKAALYLGGLAVSAALFLSLTVLLSAAGGVVVA